MTKSRSGSANGKESDTHSNHDSISDKSVMEDSKAKSDSDSSDSSVDEVPAKKAEIDSKQTEVSEDVDKKRSKSRSRSKSHHRRHHHKGDRKVHRHGRRHHSRSSDRHRKSRHKKRKHSRSSDRHKHRRRRSSSPKPSTRRKSRSGSRSRRRSRDRHYRHRSRSRSGSYRRGFTGRKLTFKDQMREKLLAADVATATTVAESAKSEAAQGKIAAAQAAAKAAATGNNLMDAIEKARFAHEQQIKEMQEKAEALTGVSIPKFYNPIAVNPLKYAEQQSKRKLLWSKKEDDKPDLQKNVNLWSSTSLTAAGGNDQAANKFRKLMGIHGAVDSDQLKSQDSEAMVDQKELFNKLDQQYEAARTHTHTQRGVGLGYSQHAYIDPNNYNPQKQLDNGDH